MNRGIKLNKSDFNEFRLRLFKKYGKNTGGNPIFINSTIVDYKSFFKSEKFLNSNEIYVFYCVYDKEYVFKLDLIENKEYFVGKKIKEYESLNLFDKDLSWVITLFNKDSI